LSKRALKQIAAQGNITAYRTACERRGDSTAVPDGSGVAKRRVFSGNHAKH